jgi:hypothetical protein
MESPISYDTVIKIWQDMAETPVEKAKDLVDLMEIEQPVVMHYLLDLEETPFDQIEKEIIFYIGTVIWQIMKQSSQPLDTAEPEDIEQAEEENFRFLKMLAIDTEADFISATHALVEGYSEPEVLLSLLETLMDDDEIDEFDDLGDDYDLDESDYPPGGNGAGKVVLDGGSSDGLVMDFDLEDDQDEDDYWEEASIRPELRSIAFAHLKTVLDALIASRDRTR